jgi:uncharacterized protein (TIGR03437 family)
MRRPFVCLPAAVCLIAALPAFAQNYPSPADLTQAVASLRKGMEVSAMTVDAQGNVYLAGAGSAGLTGATATLGPRGSSDMFVIKLTPNADQVLYAVSIGGTGDESVRTIHADGSGNLYLIGTTTSFDFPTTTQFTPNAPFGGIALKLNATGNALLYATQLGWRVAPLALDVDGSGAALIAGQANGNDLPNFPGVIDPSPAENSGLNDYVGFIAKLNGAGTAFLTATYYGPKDQWIEAISIRPNGNIFAMHFGSLVAFDSALSQVLFTSAVDLRPVSMNFDQTGFIYLLGDSTLPSGGVVLKRISADGQTTLLNRTLPFLPTYPPPRMAVTALGRMYVFGQPTTLVGRPNPPAFPTLNASQPCLANIAPPEGSAGLPVGGTLVDPNGYPPAIEQAMMVLDPDGGVLHSTFFAPRVPAVALSPVTGNIYAAGNRTLFTAPGTEWSGLIRFNPNLVPADEVSPSCVVHSATFAPVPLSPGALMSFYGSNLGPGTFQGDYTEGAFFALDSEGKAPFSLGGASVTVDGKPAALLFVWNKQINFIVPWTTRTDGALVPVCVTRNSITKCLQVPTAPAVPGVFERGAVSAALNEDWSVHEVSNPAPPGSIVQVFMTGGGLLQGSMIDGGVTPVPPAGPLLPVLATVTATASPVIPGGCTFLSCEIAPGSGSTEVYYAGAAPALVMGVLQVNFRVPANMPSGLQTFALSFLVPGAQTPVTAIVRLQVE